MKLDIWDFLKISQEKSSFIKTWHKYQALYTKMYVHLWYYLTQFSL